MLKRLRLPSPAMVVAMIALFAALGGGYATAFSGSGSLQKAAEDGVAQGAFEDIRTLTGFGTVRAQCNIANDRIDYRLVNTTGKPISFRGFFEQSASATTGGVNPGNAINFNSGVGGTNTLRLHLYKEADGVKAQVDMVLTNDGPFLDNCQDAEIRVLALNTQQ